MTAREALYRAVLEHPDDDLPRLAYADWCEEHGDPEYARFIRTQVELAKVPDSHPLWLWTGESDWGMLTGRAFEQHLPTLPPGFQWPPGGRFRRGFAWSVLAVGIESFLDHAPALFAAAPIGDLDVRADYRAPPPDLGPLADSPYLARLRRLTFRLARLPADAVRRLAESPHAAGLTDLGFEFAGIAADALEGLFRSPLATRLTALRLHSNDLPTGGRFRAALGAAGPFCLRRLTVRDCRLGVGDAAGLLAAPLSRGLEELDLAENRLGPDWFAVLASSPAATTLRSLILWKSRPGVPGVRALAGSPALAGLRRLNLANCGLGPSAAKVLAASPHLRNLADLDLAGNAIGDAGAVALADSTHLRNLIRLDLSDAEVGDRGVEALLDSPVMAGLSCLTLSWVGRKVRLSDTTKQRLRDRFGERA